MIHILTRNWWALAVRGLAAIVFGVLTFIWPGVTLTFLAILFGVYAFFDGIFSFIAAFRGGTAGQRWWALLIEGVLGVAAGVISFVAPPVTVIALIYLVGVWAIVTGILELVAAAQLRQHLKGELLLILMGALSILFGGLLLIQPGAGAVVIAYWIGAYALVFGILMIALAFRIRSHPGATVV